MKRMIVSENGALMELAEEFDQRDHLYALKAVTAAPRVNPGQPFDLTRQPGRGAGFRIGRGRLSPSISRL
jgi:hypothetical protein